MMEFNLIASTGRTFERQAECELWFNILSLGDEYPIFSQTGNSGLFVIKTQSKPRDLIKQLNKMISTYGENSIKFIQKVIPVDAVVPTDINLIREKVLNLVKISPLCQDLSTKYRISIRKRQTPLKTNEIIPAIADNLPYSVSLKEYDWRIQIEIVGDLTGIAIITDNDIFKLKNNSEK